MEWSAQQYVRFEDERTRPVRDLLAAVPTRTAGRIIDLGCGPGNSTALLAARFPDATLAGLDSSADMLAAARRRLPDTRFIQADLGTWDGDGGGWDAILSNAVLQWVPDHAALLPRLVGHLAPGGSLAVQMPDNLDQPSHRLMSEVAAQEPWAEALAGASGARHTIGTPAWYYGLLRPLCARVDVWRTTYHHPLRGAEGVVDWFKGSGLRPFLARLPESEQGAYLDRYRQAIAAAYPADADGTVLLPFQRLFIDATR